MFVLTLPFRHMQGALNGILRAATREEIQKIIDEQTSDVLMPLPGTDTLALRDWKEGSPLTQFLHPTALKHVTDGKMDGFQELPDTAEAFIEKGLVDARKALQNQFDLIMSIPTALIGPAPADAPADIVADIQNAAQPEEGCQQCGDCQCESTDEATDIQPTDETVH
jgi:hypothetical protein